VAKWMLLVLKNRRSRRNSFRTHILRSQQDSQRVAFEKHAANGACQG
jgi:hypothetical protein